MFFFFFEQADYMNFCPLLGAQLSLKHISIDL